MRVNDRNFIESEVHNAWAESEKPGNRVGDFLILFGMKELEKLELVEVNGGLGGWYSLIKKGFWMMLGGYVIDHWSDIKSGIVDGYNDGIADNK